MTRREAATVIAALLYYQSHSVVVLTSVHMPLSLSGETPLSQDEVSALVIRLTAGEVQEEEDES